MNKQQNRRRPWWRKHVTPMQAIGIQRVITCIHKSIIVTIILIVVLLLLGWLENRWN